MRHNSTQATQTWRTKQYIFRFSRHQILLINVRKFRTKSSNRSKQYRQFVLLVNNYPHPVREIAFRLKPYTKRQRQPLVLPSHLDLRPRKLIPRLLLSVGILGIVFFGLQTLGHQNMEPPANLNLPTPTAVAQASPTPKRLAKSVPTSVRIERLGINYPTIQVGKLADGTMETPPVLESVTGWYKHSPTPGEVGPSVIVGHVDSYKGPSVFWRLREAVAGDIIEVTRADGSTVKFKVESLKQFDQSNFPTAEVYGNTKDAALRLITCGGTFNKATQQYSENTVVFARILEDS